MSPAPLPWVSFRLPRRGHPAEECQDACAAAAHRGRFAVADGAAESADAGPWARLLVEAFTAADDLPARAGWIVAAQARWLEQTGPQGPLPWYLEERQRHGAFATFLGLVIDGGRWQAIAVGDSCLFHVRAGRLLTAFPLGRSGDFDNAPWLIGARTAADKVPLGHAAAREGEASPGDQFWLMTDALARWFLGCSEGGARPWEELAELARAGEAAFAAWVERRRDARDLRNDDTTLVGVRL